MGGLQRLSTYGAWPSSTAVSPITLAYAGFRYTGPGDRVACPVCRVQIEGWPSIRHHPSDEHRVRSPHCALAVECSAKPDDDKPAGNSSGGGLLAAAFRTVDVLHQVNNARANERQPPRLDEASSPAVVAGGKRDVDVEVIGSSDVRTANDVVVVGETITSTGRRQSATLSAVLQAAIARAESHGFFDTIAERSSAVVQSVPSPIDRRRPDFDRLRAEATRLGTYHDWPTTANVEPPALAADGWFYTGKNDRVCCAFCRGILHHWARDDVPASEHRRHFADCPFVRGLDVGNVPLDENRRKPDTGRATDVTGHELGAAVASAKTTDLSDESCVGGVERRDDESAVVSSAKRKSADEAAAGGIGHDVQVKRADDGNGTPAGTAADDDETQRLLRENERLVEARTCKVCMDKEVDTVFLPCGHLVSCHECAPKLRNCPVCRTYVRGTVKTFLS